MVSIEKRIVAASIKSRAAYERLKGQIDRDTLTPYSTLVLSLADNFYAKDKEAKAVDLEYLLDRIKTDLDNPTKASTYANYATECFNLELSALNVADIILTAKEKESAQELAQSLINGTTDKSKLIDSIDKHRSLLESGVEPADESDTQVLHAVSVEDINRAAGDNSAKIKLVSPRLTTELDGGALPGHHILIFARPETGKTGLVLTMMRSLGKQKLPGLYFGNEDPILSIIERYQGCLTGMTRMERLRDPDAARQVLEAQGYPYARFISLAPGSAEEIEKYIKQFGAKWAVVDQIRNLKTKAENRTNQLETIATDMRNIGKRNGCLMISVTQAGDSASDKLILDMGDVDSSNTGIPAQMDVMIGIGVNAQHEQMRTRILSFPKNKLGGTHGSFAMNFNNTTSRYEDVA